MSRLLLVIIGLVLIGLAGVAAYQAAAAVVRPDPEADFSIKRMQSLNAIEHERLKADFETFYQLSPQKQRELRALHDTLQQSGKGHRLRQISENYYQWYAELGPRCRTELRHETDVDKKLDLVRRFQKDLSREQDRPWYGRGKSRRKLSSADLANVMEVVEQKLREEHGGAGDQLDQITDPKGIRRYYAVMQILIRDSELSRSWERGTQKIQEFFADDRFLEVISNKRLHKFLMTEDSTDTDEQQHRENARTTRSGRSGRSLVYLIIGGMVAAYHDEINKNKPTEKVLMDHFAELGASEQDRLMRLLRPEQFMEELEEDYAREYPNLYPPNPRDLFSRGRRGNGPGDRRGPPGDRFRDGPIPSRGERRNREP